MVSLVVVLVLMFAFQLFGFLTVGKKQIAARRQHTEDNQVSYHPRSGRVAKEQMGGGLIW